MQALSLVRIVLNTIDNHFHRCQKVDDPTLCAASSAYSREVSQGSIGGNETEHPADSPPQSPGLFPGGGRITLVTGGPHTEARAQYVADHKSAFTPVGQDTRGMTMHGHLKLGSIGSEDSRKQRKNNESK
ncbi:uncharacterized protein [Cherax quadricarinatus]|uniref:uncharacterized protein n=1 Tax=Cherax quadricarinatus TaxID=27406 RepID=UPI00387E3BFE